MSLADSRNAIGAISEVLQVQLTNNTSAASVDVGRPEAAAAAGGPKLNLFLYQIGHDGYLGNHPLDPGQPPPLWLVLRYLLTAYDKSQDSDSSAAHQLLGEGLLALQALNFLRPPQPALADNPEPLKITFDNADAELLSKVMQGTDERYRVSAGFQVRPVMIVGGEPPSYALPVKTVGPADAGPDVLPSLGPWLDRLDPERFEAGDTVTLSGQGLSSEVTEVAVGSAGYPVTAAPSGRVVAVIPDATSLSPGSYPVSAVRFLPSGRRLASNALLGHLVPSVTTAAHGALADQGGGNFSGDLTLSGARLGGPDDAIFVAFYRNGSVALMVEAAGVAAQTTLTATVPPDDALPAGLYRIILRVNGEQAPHAPEVDWS